MIDRSRVTNALAMAVQDLAPQPGQIAIPGQPSDTTAYDVLKALYADCAAGTPTTSVADVQHAVTQICANHPVNIDATGRVTGTPLAMRLNTLHYVLNI